MNEHKNECPGETWHDSDSSMDVNNACLDKGYYSNMHTTHSSYASNTSNTSNTTPLNTGWFSSSGTKTTQNRLNRNMELLNSSRRGIYPPNTQYVHKTRTRPVLNYSQITYSSPKIKYEPHPYTPLSNQAYSSCCRQDESNSQDPYNNNKSIFCTNAYYGIWIGIFVYYVILLTTSIILWKCAYFPYDSSHISMNPFNTITFDHYNRYYSQIQFHNMDNDPIQIFSVPSNDQISTESYHTNTTHKYNIRSFDYAYDHYWLNKGSNIEILAQSDKDSSMIILNKAEFNKWITIGDNLYRTQFEQVKKYMKQYYFKSNKDGEYYFVFHNDVYNEYIMVNATISIDQVYLNMNPYHSKCVTDYDNKCTIKNNKNDKIVLASPLVNRNKSYKIKYSLTKDPDTVNTFYFVFWIFFSLPIMIFMLTHAVGLVCDKCCTKTPLTQSDFDEATPLTANIKNATDDKNATRGYNSISPKDDESSSEPKSPSSVNSNDSTPKTNILSKAAHIANTIISSRILKSHSVPSGLCSSCEGDPMANSSICSDTVSNLKPFVVNDFDKI